MTVNEISQLIGSVGFPIVASCAMFYLYNKTVGDITSTLALMNQTLTQIMCELRGGADDDQTPATR